MWFITFVIWPFTVGKVRRLDVDELRAFKPQLLRPSSIVPCSSKTSTDQFLTEKNKTKTNVHSTNARLLAHRSNELWELSKTLHFSLWIHHIGACRFLNDLRSLGLILQERRRADRAEIQRVRAEKEKDRQNRIAVKQLSPTDTRKSWFTPSSWYLSSPHTGHVTCGVVQIHKKQNTKKTARVHLDPRSCCGFTSAFFIR